MSYNTILHKSAALLAAVIAVLMAACASIGRPEGGPRDYQPPRFVRSNPAPGALNATPRRMEIIFDENVELEDAFNKVKEEVPEKAEEPMLSLRDGNTTFLIGIHFNQSSRETLEDKVKKLIRNEVRKGNIE